MKTKHLVLGVVLSASLALTACGGGAKDGAAAKSGEPEKGGTVSVLLNADYSHLDPAMGFDGGVNNFYRLIYRTLTTNSTVPGKTSEMVPDLATDMGKSSDGGKTWTFTLKDGLKFDDGTPITSQDVKFGVERSFDPALGIGSPYARTLLDDGSGYKGPYEDKGKDFAPIQTPDDKTVVFHLNQPYADFGSVVGQNSFVPFPVGSGAGTAFDAMPIASGPYKVESYNRGSELKLVRNTNWSAATDTVRKAYPDNFDFKFGIDGATIDERLLADQSGDKDTISGQSLQPANVARVQTPQVQDRAVKTTAICTTYMGLNTTKPHLSDVRVRQAINYAIDKSSVQTASGGSQLATIANTIMVPSLLGRKDFNLYPSTDNKGDVAKAKALMSEAGLSNGFDLTLDTRGTPMIQAQSEAVQQSLAKIGITVKLNVIDSSTFYEVIGTRTQQHDATITGWCPDWASGATFLPPILDGKNITDKGNSNVAQFNDPAVNKQMATIAAMTDVDAANKAYGDLDEQIMKEGPLVPLVYQNGLQLTGSNIGKGVIGFNGGLDLVTVGLANAAK